MQLDTKNVNSVIEWVEQCKEYKTQWNFADDILAGGSSSGHTVSHHHRGRLWNETEDEIIPFYINILVTLVIYQGIAQAGETM